MRCSSLGLAGVVAACLLSVSAHAFSTGISGRSGKQGVTCMNGCHGANAPSPLMPTVELTGPAMLAPGATGDYALIIRGGPAREGGLNVAVSDNGGTLAGTGTDTKILAGELTHTSPKTFPASGELRFDFRLTAPDTVGTVTLYGTGNSVNDNGTNAGDQAASDTLEIQVGEASKPEEEDKGCAAAGGPPLGLLLVLLARTLRRRA
jgi:hypothetical protein